MYPIGQMVDQKEIWSYGGFVWLPFMVLKCSETLIPVHLLVLLVIVVHVWYGWVSKLFVGSLSYIIKYIYIYIVEREWSSYRTWNPMGLFEYGEFLQNGIFICEYYDERVFFVGIVLGKSVWCWTYNRFYPVPAKCTSPLVSLFMFTHPPTAHLQRAQRNKPCDNSTYLVTWYKIYRL